MSCSINWPVPTERGPLSSQQLHVWAASLVVPPEQLQQLKRFLSPDEGERANKFHFERDKNHFIVSRGMLRWLIGRYLKTPPEQLQFEYNDFGKPALKTLPKEAGLQFNAAHSNELALFAFCRNCQIGVDVEKIRHFDEMSQIAARYFAGSELQILQALPAERQVEGFFQCWTRKEAYIKAKGAGLSIELDRFAVGLAPGNPVRFLQIDGSETKAKQWSLFALNPASEYVGAVAVNKRNWQLSCWRLPEGLG